MLGIFLKGLRKLTQQLCHCSLFLMFEPTLRIFNWTKLQSDDGSGPLCIVTEGGMLKWEGRYHQVVCYSENFVSLVYSPQSGRHRWFIMTRPHATQCSLWQCCWCNCKIFLFGDGLNKYIYIYIYTHTHTLYSFPFMYELAASQRDGQLQHPAH